MRLILWRAAQSAPGIAIPVIVVLVINIGIIALAILVAPEQKPHVEFNEGGLVTAVTAVSLAMASGFAALCFFLKNGQGGWPRYFWLLTALGLLFFSLDDLLEFHERLGRWLRHTDIGPTTAFRNWNDVIVIAYGVVGLGTLIGFMPEILRYPRVFVLLTTGFGFYCIHTVIDSTQRASHVSIILEESAKLFACTFFCLAMFIAVLGVVVSTSASPASSPRTP